MSDLLERSGFRLTTTPDDLLAEVSRRLSSIEVGSAQEVAARTLYNRLCATQSRIMFFMSYETSQILSAIENGECPRLENAGTSFDDIYGVGI